MGIPKGFPREVERLENLQLVFQPFHGPSFPQPSYVRNAIRVERMLDNIVSLDRHFESDEEFTIPSSGPPPRVGGGRRRVVGA